MNRIEFVFFSYCPFEAAYGLAGCMKCSESVENEKSRDLLYCAKYIAKLPA